MHSVHGMSSHVRKPLGHCGLDNQCMEWDGQRDGLLTIMNGSIVVTKVSSVVLGGDGIVVVSRGYHIGGSV